MFSEALLKAFVFRPEYLMEDIQTCVVPDYLFVA